MLIINRTPSFTLPSLHLETRFTKQSKICLLLFVNSRPPSEEHMDNPVSVLSIMFFVSTRTFLPWTILVSSLYDPFLTLSCLFLPFLVSKDASVEEEFFWETREDLFCLISFTPFLRQIWAKQFLVKLM